MNRTRLLCGCLVVFAFAARAACAQTADLSPPADEPAEAEAADSTDAVPEKVDVRPGAADSEISARLQRILEATDWFAAPQVRVDEGVVFLNGRVTDEQHRAWAGKLAGNTEDVVAVVNRIEVEEPSMWDLSPAWNELEQLTAEAVRSSPLILLGLVLLVLTWLAAKLAVRTVKFLLSKHVSSLLLRDVAGRAAAAPVFLLGLYLVLRVSGLTRLAVTVLGGTGLIGLVVGFAFRDIAENFLASVLISAQHPFARGDLIKVANYQGFVQSVNTRSTLLMTLDGNHVQIPNATIYKETIVNFTANTNGRFEFDIGIGYDDSIAKAQRVALETLREHPAVLESPEPMILVNALGAATVNLTVYFWVDIVEHSGLKVRSAVIRQVKSAFDRAGISMPDEAREVVFPHGVPVAMVETDNVQTEPRDPPAEEVEPDWHEAEGDLDNEAKEIEEQARSSRTPEGGENLLGD